MGDRDNLDQDFVDQAEADLMAALGISDTKQGAKELEPSSKNNNNKNKNHNRMKSDQDLAGLAEILPEVNVRRPGDHPIEDENEAGVREDGVDSVTPAAENEGSDSKPPPIAVARQSSIRANASRDIGDTGHSKNTASRDVASGELDVFQAGEGGAGNSFDDYPDSENALEDDYNEDPDKVPKEFVNSSAQSISTATRQTHDVKMPMYLPNFKPATGCTNASDFIVRCFVARLRSGITVVKHGRSRWCKSRLRVLQIHPDGRSLSWKPAEGEPSSSKKPPRLDLTTCTEVRHAWSPDPQNPMYTGTPILRQKCEAANAHKSFALIFKNRTVDITGTSICMSWKCYYCFVLICFLILFLLNLTFIVQPSLPTNAKC